METYRFESGTVSVVPSWTLQEIRLGVASLLDSFAARLPADKRARVVIKPNLNNDLVALTGNSADLRVLAALCEAFQDRGYTDLTLADGSNVGVERRGIDTFRRLRIDRLAHRYGIRLVDLNHDVGDEVTLGSSTVRIARTILESELLVSVPKVKTHAEARLSCALKNWVGIVRGQDKRVVHEDLARNILRLHEIAPPHLVLVDGLVAMEGNGPGDGEPCRLGRLVMSDRAVLCDLVVARMVDLPWEQVGYLREAFGAGWFDVELVSAIRAAVPVVRSLRQAPPRPKLQVLSERADLMWLKRAVRPLVDRSGVSEAAHGWGVVQDVYSKVDDEVLGVRRNATDCGDCRKCEEFCPTGLLAADIGVKTEPADCIGCLYCWWVCPKGALDLEGAPGFIDRHARRYKARIEGL